MLAYKVNRAISEFMGAIYRQAWILYQQSFLLMNLLILCIWMPGECFFSYMEYNYPHADDLYFYAKLEYFYIQIVGLIAIGGIFYCFRERAAGKTPAFGSALLFGLSYWGRMFITRVVISVVIIIGSLFFVLPGIYAAIRFCLGDSIVVAEGLSGSAAARRSYHLTKEKFGELLLWWSAGLVPILVVMAVLTRLQECEVFNGWIARSILLCLQDLLVPVMSSIAWAIYLRLSKDEAVKASLGATPDVPATR